jgi:hypothetical protein
MQMKVAPLVFALALTPTVCVAEDHETHSRTMPMETMGGHAMHGHVDADADPESEIRDLLRTMFDAPDKPLTVDPVVVVEDWAVAGWLQDGKGGRVLLHNEDQAWRLQVLGGDTLKTSDGLAEHGVGAEAARKLADQQASAEQALGLDVLKLLDSFQGSISLVKIDAKPAQDHAGH